MIRSQTPTYRRWIAMKSRCCNPKHSRYKDWGGKGIKVCKQWLNSFDNFLADMGEVPSQFHTLDRIDPNGDYTPENCRWATRKEQQRNRADSMMLTFKDQTLNSYDWADKLGLPHYVIRDRIKKRGWSIADALTTPVNTNCNHTGKVITFNGVSKNISEWAKSSGIKLPTLWWRINQGWPLDSVFKELLEEDN